MCSPPDLAMPCSDGFEPMFNGRDLTGWQPVPRIYGTVWPGGPSAYEHKHPEGAPELATRYPAVWTVEEGVLVGRQNSERPGYGGYLLSERDYGDFELVLELNPDWPADTGVMVRRRPDSWHCFQILVDHRPEGSIGGFYGNGLASFHAAPFMLDAVHDDSGAPIGLIEFDGVQNPARSGFAPEKRALLEYATTPTEFIGVWRFGDWNELRIRCVGELPVLTTWVNGLEVAELDTARITWPEYDAEAVRGMLGARGRIALEVHDDVPGADGAFWGPGAVCRWRNIRVNSLA